VLFSSGIWYEKLIFLKTIFKENFIYFKNVTWLYLYSGTPVARPPTGRHSIGRVAGWGGRVTLAFLKVACIIAVTSFLQFYIQLKVALSYLLLLPIVTCVATGVISLTCDCCLLQHQITSDFYVTVS